MMGVQSCHLALCFLLIHARDHVEYLYAAVAVAALGLAWVASFGFERSNNHNNNHNNNNRRRWTYKWEGACCVAFVAPLRIGCQLVVLYVTLLAALARARASGDNDDDNGGDSSSELLLKALAYGAAAVVAATGSAALCVRKRAHDALLRSLRASGLAATVSALQRLSGVLSVGEAVGSGGGWATEGERRAGWDRKLSRARSPRHLRRLLLTFERHVLAERLTARFVVHRRNAWRSAVARCESFAQVDRLAAELSRSVATRPPTKLLTALVGRVLSTPREGTPYGSAVWETNRVLSFLLPKEYFMPGVSDAFSASVLEPRPSAPSYLRFADDPDEALTDFHHRNGALAYSDSEGRLKASRKAEVQFQYHLKAAAHRLNEFANAFVLPAEGSGSSGGGGGGGRRGKG